MAMVASGLLVLPSTTQPESSTNTAAAAQHRDTAAAQPATIANATPATPFYEAIAPQPAPLSEQEQLAAFAARYNLTPRETDVLKAITTDERPLKQVANDLGISLRMVQRHLTSLYQKTGTQTRTGLAMKYLEEK